MTSFCIAAISLACVLGLGRLLGRILRIDPGAGATFAYGLLLLYTALLVTPTLEAALILGALGSLAGWALEPPRRISTATLAAGAAFALFTVKILGEPLEAWDARSIWFFHAKKIFYNDSLWVSTGWTNPFYAFSHADYPLLVPALAAAAARAVGGWNELAPKVSLLLILAPALLSLRSLRAAPASATFLGGLLLLRFGDLLWNGYLDGYVALYAALSTLHFGEWLEERRPENLFAGAAMLAVVLNLKNEGGIVLAATLLALATAGCSGALRKAAVAAPLCFAIFDRVLLIGRNALWGVTSDLQSPSTVLHSVLARLSDPYAWGLVFIDGVHTGQVDRAVILLLLLLIPARRARAQLPRAAVFSAACAGFYFAALSGLYLFSPYELDWHVSHSADRTMLPVTSLVFVVFFFCLRGLEKGTFSLARRT